MKSRKFNAWIALTIIVIGFSCKAKQSLETEVSVIENAMRYTLGVEVMTILDDKNFMILKKEREYIERCFAQDSLLECCDINAPYGEVIKRARIIPIMGRIRGTFVVKYNIGVNPEGKVVMVRLAEHTHRKTDKGFYNVGARLMDMEYAPDGDASCLRFYTYTINKEDVGM